jgi:hypothetical protein
MPVNVEFWGILFPEVTLHAVCFLRRTMRPEGCGRRIAKLGELPEIGG